MKKREEYHQYIVEYFGEDAYLSRDKNMPTQEELETYSQKTMKEVRIDVRRTMPEIPVFCHDLVQCMLSRILFVWSMKHPASGYVQGINDLASPFILVFLGE